MHNPADDDDAGQDLPWLDAVIARALHLAALYTCENMCGPADLDATKAAEVQGFLTVLKARYPQMLGPLYEDWIYRECWRDRPTASDRRAGT